MLFKFKQAVCLGKKDYALGVHELPESVLEKLAEDKTFLKYQELGLIEKAAPKTIGSDSLEEKNKKLVEKAMAPKVIEPKIEAPVETKAAESIEAPAEEVKDEASSKKKKR